MYTQEQHRDHIRELQEYLRTLSATDERYPLVGVDGIYGPNTEQAVRVFQTITGSPVTGIVQRADFERIQREYRQLLSGLLPARSISPFPDATFILRPASQDPLVYILQVMLNALSTQPLPVNGVYDADTEQRVRTFQTGADLPPNGEVDRITWDQLALAYDRRL